MLGGSAVHFALAASFFTDVHVVGPVGDDFGDEHVELLSSRGVDVADIERVAGGRTFFWRGHYEADLNVAHTDDTQLGVFADFEPKLSEASRRAEVPVPGQHPARPPAARAGPVRHGSARGARLDEPLDRDHARLAGRRGRRGRLRDAQRRRGANADRGAEPRPRRPGADGDGPPNRGRQARRVRRGAVHRRRRSSRCRASCSRTSATRPAPGDSFAGGFLGYLDMQGTERPSDAALRRAVAYGTVLASFNVEEFGTERVARLTKPEIARALRAAARDDPLRAASS